MSNLIAIVLHFMRTNQQGEVVVIEESLGDVRAELDTSTTTRGLCATDIGGIRPQDLLHQV